jgi:hypothetical protein
VHKFQWNNQTRTLRHCTEAAASTDAQQTAATERIHTATLSDRSPRLLDTGHGRNRLQQLATGAGPSSMAGAYVYAENNWAPSATRQVAKAAMAVSDQSIHPSIHRMETCHAGRSSLSKPKRSTGAVSPDRIITPAIPKYHRPPGEVRRPRASGHLAGYYRGAWPGNTLVVCCICIEPTPDRSTRPSPPIIVPQKRI